MSQRQIINLNRDKWMARYIAAAVSKYGCTEAQARKIGLKSFEVENERLEENDFQPDSPETCAIDDFGEYALLWNKANARLIASAPELLAALEALVTTHFASEDEYDEAITAARAAIAKAKGE